MASTTGSGRDAPADTQIDPEQWVRRHADALFGHAVLRVRAPEIAEDMVQETFLAAWSGRNKFEGRASERTWLLGILGHKIADYYRDRARRLQFEDMEALAEFEATQFKPGLTGTTWARAAIPMSWHHVRESVEKAEFWETVGECAGKLPEKLARAFLLREVEQWDSTRICETMSISPAHLFVMLHRARLALRHCLERNWFVRAPKRLRNS